MQKIARIYKDLTPYLDPNKVLVIYGPRQVGKTTLLENYLSHCPYKYKYDSGDNIEIRHTLASENFSQIKAYAEGYELIALDEAQRIPNIGQCLKILVDQITNIRIITTGSSSFELAGQIGEPLTGRKITLSLFPISQLELLSEYSPFELKQQLTNFLIYGLYPEILTAQTIDKKMQLLTELVHSYLLKDILELEKIKSSQKLLDLLRLLAFQIGSEVSTTELGKQLSLDHKTIARYLDLLEKSFIIFSVSGYSRNLRKEISKKSKYYFYDNGVRNALISNFNSINMRNDIGLLWENFIFIERMKKRSYKNIYANIFFWRTWNGQEIDLIEEHSGELFGYEIKWNTKAKVKEPKLWRETYANAHFEIINPNNYLGFIT